MFVRMYLRLRAARLGHPPLQLNRTPNGFLDALNQTSFARSFAAAEPAPAAEGSPHQAQLFPRMAIQRERGQGLEEACVLVSCLRGDLAFLTDISQRGKHRTRDPTAARFRK